MIKQLPNYLRGGVVPPPVIRGSPYPLLGPYTNAGLEQENSLRAELLEILGAIVLISMLAWWSLNPSPARQSQLMENTLNVPRLPEPVAAPRLIAYDVSLRQRRDDVWNCVSLLAALLKLQQQQFDRQLPTMVAQSPSWPDLKVPQYSQEYIDLLAARREELKEEAAELRKRLENSPATTDPISVANRDRTSRRLRSAERRIFDTERIIVLERDAKGSKAPK